MKNLLSLVLLVTFGIAVAQKTPKIDKRQQIQKTRIVKGVKNGKLNRRETALLAKQQLRIKRLEKAAKRDGKVTPKERARITKAQNRANRTIRAVKNN